MRQFVVAVAGVAAVVAVLLLTRSAAGPDDRVGSAGAVSEPARTAVSSQRESETRVPADEPRAPERVAVAGSRLPATLMGRCVDGEGRPLAGVRVEVILQRNPDPNRVAESDLRTGGVAWTSPDPVITAADGCFSFGFVPLPVRKYAILAEKPGHVLAHEWSEELTPGNTADFGDLQMPAGCLLRGVVRDRTGAPVRGLYLGLATADGVSTPWTGERTADDGSFAIRSPAPPGSYLFRCSDPLEPPTVELGGADEQFVELTLARPGIEQTIEGVAIDSMSSSLAETRITATAGDASWSSRTGPDGRFVLARRADEPTGPVQLSVRLEYDRVEHDEPVAWGARGVRFVVNTGVPVEVRVVDGASREPVERFGVRLVPTIGPGVGYDSSRRLRGVGDHPDGRCQMGAFVPGPYMLSVETAGLRHPPTAYRRVEIGEGLPSSFLVEVWPAARITCDVFAGGIPKVASHVELLVVSGGRDGDPPRVVRPRTMPYFGDGRMRYGTLLAQATTGAEGRAVLFAPRGGPFAVRITGDHEIVYREGVHVTGDTELRFAVLDSASLLVQVRPWPLPAKGAATLIVAPPAVSRTRPDPAPRPVQAPPIDTDGRFRIVGIAPGSVRLAVPLRMGVGQGELLDQIYVDVVGLGRAEQREVEVDVTPWLPVELLTRVLVNGVPAAGAMLVLHVTGADEESVGRVRAKLDGDGRAAVGVPRGRVTGTVHISGAHHSIPLEPFRIGDDPPERTIELSTGDVRVRLLASNGLTPLAGIELILHERTVYETVLQTDANGVVDLGPIPCGPFALAMWPRRLAHVTARMQLASSVGNISAHLVHLTPRTVIPGSQTFELIVPPTAGYR